MHADTDGLDRSHKCDYNFEWLWPRSVRSPWTVSVYRLLLFPPFFDFLQKLWRASPNKLSLHHAKSFEIRRTRQESTGCQRHYKPFSTAGMFPQLFFFLKKQRHCSFIKHRVKTVLRKSFFLKIFNNNALSNSNAIRKVYKGPKTTHRVCFWQFSVCSLWVFKTL